MSHKMLLKLSKQKVINTHNSFQKTLFHGRTEY